MKFIKNLLSISLLILSVGCSSLNFQKTYILPNELQGKSVRIAKLTEDYKRNHRFNKVFSKFNSKRFIPFYKFVDKKYNVVGSYLDSGKSYIIIKDERNRLFKAFLEKKNLPSFIVLEENIEKAKKLIDTNIWLNNVYDGKNFITYFPEGFYPFKNVQVKDVMIFQNSDNGHAIWLQILSNDGESAMVRYNFQGLRVKTKDHYFTTDPLPKHWGKNVNEKIKNRKADIGMSSLQVRIALGYPDEINNTSSRHGLSEQWIYDLETNKKYYQFEYDKLVYIND